MANKTDYRIIKLTDSTTLMGSITVDKDFLRISDALELQTVQRDSGFGIKDDSVLAPWMLYTTDKQYVIPRDKVLVIAKADKNISNYYEVILAILNKDAKTNAPLSAREIEKIYHIADKLDQAVNSENDNVGWTEEDLIDLYSKKTIH
jgi:hypothetical protein